MEVDDPIYIAAKLQGMAMVKAGTEALYKKYRLDVLLYPTSPTPPPLIKGDPTPAPGPRAGRGDAGTSTALNIANIAGFPELVIPAGMTKDGLPVTISLLGEAFSEPKLLAYGYDFEQATHARVNPKYTPTLPGDSFGN
jgi:amidase